jgi:RHS repeat-associated protein
MKSNLLQCNEQFGYDALNRLNSIKLNSAAPQTISYAANGNITSKYDVGTYSYNNNNHAVSGVQSFGYTPPGSDVALLSSITHTSYNRVSEIVKNNNTLTYSYGSDKLRNKSIYMSGATDVDVKYYVGSYEKAINSGGNPVATLKEHDYIYSPESLAAIVTKSMIGTYSLNYVHTDHLGSPRVITNSGKTIISRYRYDAWGTRTLVSGTNITTRGFTGHEHLDDYFGLINMNARLYDPALGRFISLDPYVQIPDFTQSFNRYSYVLNNPLVYTDPSGEFFIIDSWLIGLFSGGWDEANRRAANDAKIWAGLFVSDPNRNFGQRLWETVSRVTWQLPQTVAGFLTSHTHNTFGLRGGVESVDYMNGATVLRTNTSWGGVTMGSYIIGGNSIRADANNPLFQHEYGHYIQSQKMGWLTLQE